MPRIITLHLDEELQARLAAAVERLEAQTPGLQVRAGTAVKVFLRRALDAEEQQQTERSSKRAKNA